jgi:drug/metabolite transporter (DMT)-like permease
MDTALPVPVFARKNVAYACATLCCLLWGSSYPAIKSGYELFQIATDDIPSKVVFAGYRFLFAGLLLLLFALAQRKPIARLSPRQFGQLTLLGPAGNRRLHQPHHAPCRNGARGGYPDQLG